MKRLFTLLLALSLLSGPTISAAEYKPSPEALKSREQFAADGFGIFLHWGIYSMFGQGEWYLNYGPTAEEYAKAAAGFYPARFNAADWVSEIKRSGARYITITTRHHDGFSMWHTAQSHYNIVDATPFGRDVLRELSDECQRQGIALHLYYSHLDWTRPDYPQGRTGHTTGRDSTAADWPAYYAFMNRQLTELLTGYGPIRAIWFDGYWDHDSDSIPFDWQLPEQYALIHRLQPSCLIANNHHETIIPGEDIQIFERDLPGQNTAGLSGQQVSQLPLETCNTMNGMWGYKIVDQNYKDARTLIHYLVKARALGANLLLNIGPQPSGELPATAVDRLHEIGRWTDRYGESIYGVTAGDFPATEWGVSTRKGDTLYIHILSADKTDIQLPVVNGKVREAVALADGRPVKYSRDRRSGLITLHLDSVPTDIDYIVRLTTR